MAGAAASPVRHDGDIDGQSGTAVIVADHITKRFPGVLAVDDFSLSIAAGEIVALLGQNGAGKSTLIQIFAGVHPQGSFQGNIVLDGRPYSPASVAAAQDAGVALVPQEVNVAPDLSVAENMFLNAEPTRWGFLDQPLRLALASRALEDFDLDIDPAAMMGSLDLSTQQLVIIARALSRNARLLILDEPTAALTEEEARRLFTRMRSLSERGVAIIFVSHRLAEVFAVSHRIVVMRDGRICGSHATAAISRDAVIAQMVGAIAAPFPPLRAAPGEVALRVEGLTVREPHDADRKRVSNIAFSLARGEVVGLFGLLGAGCIEAALAIYGAWRGRVEGNISLDGRRVDISSPARAVALGMGLMAQDRRDCLLLEHSVNDNAMLACLADLSPRGLLDIGEQRRRTIALVDRLDIKARSIDVEVGTLSGGNQQKVQLARWLAAKARILILIDPTRGVDVGARAEIKGMWSELRAAGHAILIASTDAEELVDICDRVLVLRHGRIAAEVKRPELSEETLLRAATDA
ncbi:MAG: sugar ABC transporter ATP-binding protein [Pseudomonadota bacterium]|nr:sugar ABC transporter ATP-binding protein [Pseudomonadota bacterium]